MTRQSARFKNVLVMTPAGAGGYNHTRGLRASCDNVFLFDYEEPLRRLGIAGVRQELSRLIAKHQIEVFFLSLYSDNYLLAPEFLLELRKSVKIVLWCWDDETSFAVHSRHYAQAVDAVVTADYFSVAAYRALGIRATLCWVNVSEQTLPALGLHRDIDVSFVGHCAKSDRPRYLDFLAANGLRVQTFGFGSEAGFVSDEEVARIFNRSKINLNFSRLEPGPARGYGHKGRPIQVAITRSFCLSEYYPALPRIFERGSEIDWFTDPASLLEKLRYYLAHDAECEKMASSAYARTLREYEDGPYFSKVMNELSAAFSSGGRPGGLALSPEFKRRRIAGLLVHGLSLLRRGKIRAFAAVVPELGGYGPSAFLAGAALGTKQGLEILRRKFR